MASLHVGKSELSCPSSWRFARGETQVSAFGEYTCSIFMHLLEKVVIMLHMPNDDWANVDSFIISQKVLKN